MVSPGDGSNQLTPAQRRNVRARELGFKSYYDRRVKEGEARGLTRRQAAGREAVPAERRFRRRVTPERYVAPPRRRHDFDRLIRRMEDEEARPIVQIFVTFTDYEGPRPVGAMVVVEPDEGEPETFHLQRSDLTQDNMDRFVDVRSDKRIPVVYAGSPEILAFEGPTSPRAMELPPESRATSKQMGNPLAAQRRADAKAKAQAARDKRNARRRAARKKKKEGGK